MRMVRTRRRVVTLFVQSLRPLGRIMLQDPRNHSYLSPAQLEALAALGDCSGRLNESVLGALKESHKTIEQLAFFRFWFWLK